ncbi:MAG: RT0821/Lpp0805 family surface protein [Desulfovibrionales bacterium]
MKTLTWMCMCLLLTLQCIGCAGTGGDGFEEYRKPGITILGAAAGGALGSMFGSGVGRGLAVGGGAIAGGALGYWIAERMEQDDQDAVSHALSENDAGETLHWRNNQTNEEFAVTPLNTYQESGQQCRDFTMTRYEAGSPEESEGTACLQDGQWTVVSSS